VLLVESDALAARVIRENIAALGLPGARLLTDRVDRVLTRGPAGAAPRDFVFADPPYKVGDDELTRVLCALRGWLAPAALVAIERATKSGAPTWPAGYETDRSRRYGEATVWYGLAAGGEPAATSPMGG
jgi:16S rRNA (guanine966-N2)-methyltransferase